MKLYISGISVIVLLVFYLPLVILFLLRIWRSGLQNLSKVTAMILVAVVAYAIPMWDVTANSVAMAKICPSAGLHIYKTVEVEGFAGGSNDSLERYQYDFLEHSANNSSSYGSKKWIRVEKRLATQAEIEPYTQEFVDHSIPSPNGYRLKTQWNANSATNEKISYYIEKKGKTGAVTKMFKIVELDNVTPKSEYEVLSEIWQPDLDNGVEVMRNIIRNRITKEVLSEHVKYQPLPNLIDRLFLYSWAGYWSPGSCGGIYNVDKTILKILVPKTKIVDTPNRN